MNIPTAEKFKGNNFVSNLGIQTKGQVPACVYERVRKAEWYI